MQIDNYGFAKEKNRTEIMKLIYDKVTLQLDLELPFAIYKKPDSETVVAFFQKNNTLFTVEDFTENGFVFASFDGSQTVLIPENQSEKACVSSDKKVVEIHQNETESISFESKSNFETLVAKGIDAIIKHKFEKVVLSRKESVSIDKFELVATLEQLFHLYPSTFSYCFYHPKVGLWLGATPEQLLKVKNTVFETIALAGTQKDTDSTEVIWADKEKEEQKYVTDYIVDIVKEVASEINVSEPFSIKAGSIWHIKTTISGVLNSSSSLKKVIQLLHPTPAVCGLPKEISKAFILENENYDRTFYTGFLGELNLDNQTDLFVNLRCMEVKIDESKSFLERSITKADLFMGCGITKDSIPEKEWNESINKSATMKKVLQKGRRLNEFTS
jgi:isochorismate synthase